ncbi:MAG: F0F1 ATP synthase subunit delta [Woeseiaceae bacterium]|nr:F0F1 ATP synthase subunit delta [Woeseiaceae bacterium]
MADNNTIARPYAQAIFEIARENDALAEFSASFAAAKQLLADDQVVAFLARPGLNDAQRLEFLQGLLEKAVGKGSVFAGGSDHGTNFFRLLLENRRVAALPEIANRFEALRARTENKVDVVVTSASEISGAQKDAIAGALRERLGQDVSIETKIDENLIGGAVIKAGDVVIDGSLRARLEGLANALAK